LGEIKDDGVCTKVAFATQKPAISLKQSGLEPKLLQSVYRNSRTAYRLMTNLVACRDLLPTWSRSCLV